MPSYEQEQSRLNRRRMLAQALSQSQPRQGQMVGRFYVAPSPLEQLAATGQQLAGAFIERKTDKEEAGLQERRRKELADALRGLSGQRGPFELPSPQNTPGGIDESGAMGGSFPGPVSATPQNPIEQAVLNATIPAAQKAPVDPQREAALAVLQGLPLEQMEGIVGQQAVANLFPKPQEGFTLGAGERRFDASGREVAAVPEKTPATPAEIQGYELAKEQGFTGSFFDYQAMLKRAGATNVNVNSGKYPNAFNEALGKADVEQLTRYQKEAEGAAKLLGTLDELEKLNPTAMSGGGAQTRAQVANWLSGWTGVDIADPGVLADTQQYNAIVTKSILDSLGGSLGAGVSNADVQFIRDTVPKLEYSPEARQQLIDYMRQRATTGLDLYRRAREFGEANQGLRGFDPYPITNPGAPNAGGKLTRNPDGTLTYNP